MIVDTVIEYKESEQDFIDYLDLEDDEDYKEFQESVKETIKREIFTQYSKEELKIFDIIVSKRDILIKANKKLQLQNRVCNN
ncbi:hypothetical protein [Methanococcus voltae]|uniref:Uncharacterized protein n=1 Tax=Methanococcus voltae (strain ATCC BAA-1334 / A3) TaxID=456320 RepID=D7DSM2_METV3|nr:hypothetical protein [Methanococcus voltae]MCS3901731.1 hypothetical protein [Methanococcus voltae]